MWTKIAILDAAASPRRSGPDTPGIAGDLVIERTPASEVSVMILCVGQGTRIREASESVPKPLIDVGGRPILWHILKTYGQYGFRHFILCLGYKGWDIKRYFLQYRENVADFSLHLSSERSVSFHDGLGDEGWEITFAETGLSTATGAR